MEEIKTVNAALDELKLPYGHEKIDDDFESYTITVDDSEDVTVTGILYRSDDGAFFRLLGYVDELSEDAPQEQMAVLLALNGDIPTGAFCMDPEEGVVYITVNMPIAEVNANLVDWVIEFLFVAQEVYSQEYYGDSGELPQG